LTKGQSGYDAPVTDPSTISPMNLAVIGGDGIGPEVTAEALKVLDAVANGVFTTTTYDLGASLAAYG